MFTLMTKMKGEPCTQTAGFQHCESSHPPPLPPTACSEEGFLLLTRGYSQPALLSTSRDTSALLCHICSRYLWCNYFAYIVYGCPLRDAIAAVINMQNITLNCT